MTQRDRAILRTDAAIDQAWREMADNLPALQHLMMQAFANRNANPMAATLSAALGLVVAELYQRSAKFHDPLLDGEVKDDQV